jgi:hypothetical protein
VVAVAMTGCPIFLHFFHIECINRIILLTFNEKKCTMANAKTFCFKTNQRIDSKEECLKSKMAEKYDLNITMTICQIEKLRKYIRYWFPMIILKMEVI